MIIVPFVDANYAITDGIAVSAPARPLLDGVQFTNKIAVPKIFK